VLLSVLALALGTSTVALADPEGVQPAGVTAPSLLALISDDDVFSTADLTTLLAPLTPLGTGNGAQHYGPFASESPDSGTCGNNWAQDMFDRHFTVRATATGFTVAEQFKNGSFMTDEGASPGACQFDDGSSTLLVTGGLRGTMHGYEIITIVGTQPSTSPFCDAVLMTNENCDTATFIDTHFAGASNVSTFFFHYAGQDGTNQTLIEHEWKNASEDRGGNHGDIATQ
jgi:hypothetical protein